MQIVDYIVLFVYFVGMVGIGIWSMRRVQKQEDYFMGGRGFGKLLQTFAAFGAGTGAHEPVAVGLTGWTSGLSGVWSALMWLFVTPVYWVTAVWYRRMRHLTLGDWFVERYESKAMGVAYTAFAFAFYIFYLSTMLSAIASFAVPLMGIETIWGLQLKYYLIPGLALIVILYGVLGGLTAAYYTDLIQGVFIILLSVLLIPFGLSALVEQFGDPASQGMMDGFQILHQRVSADYFNLFGGPSAGEFPPMYIVSLSILGVITVVVQPHFIATGGGSAKAEDEARIGLVVGNFLKRLCTVGWALTALIALALLADSADIVKDPDRVWGVAAREILGPLNIGLVGLMLACLMAAMMSSADAYMIVTSALVTRNVYAAYIDDKASEQTYLLVGRLTGLFIIVGASAIAIFWSDVFGQFKLAIELPILFAAPFWIGMYWRRVNRTAVWITITFSLLFFFVLPILLPMLLPGLKSNPSFAVETNRITKTFSRTATAADVARYEAWQRVFDQATREQDKKTLDKLGSPPPKAVEGEVIELQVKSGGQALFWAELSAPGEVALETVSETEEQGTRTVVEKRVGSLEGSGLFKLDFLLYSWLGVDLSAASKSTIETLRLPPRVLLPFLVLAISSFLTPRNSEKGLHRYYAKMNTPVHPDPAIDKEALEKAYNTENYARETKLFPNSDFEFVRPSTKDVVGFLISVLVCAFVIGLLVFLAGVGA
ncbi:MAG: sodium:solute symporter family protein [Planctomycetota bacterium]